MVIIIIGILLLLVSIFILSVAHTQMLDNSKLRQERDKIIAQYNETELNYAILTDRYSEVKSDYNALREQESRLNTELKEKQALVNNFLDVEKQKVQEQLELFKANSNYAMQNYISAMEENYNQADKNFDTKILALTQEYDKIKAEFESIRSTLTAATEARIREEEKKGNLDFYKLQVTPIELDDIVKLEGIKPMLHNPVILSKLIWSTYYQKPYKALCSRVLKEDVVCGIYKITDLTTDQYYIGQSVDITKRWCDHIKAGLGIDNNGTNKLYKAMQAHGVHNFTFELLEACERKELNEKEKFFIGLYQSDKYGLNTTKGND